MSSCFHLLASCPILTHRNLSPQQVLKGERDALMKLIQSMRKEYEAVQGAKGAQEDELRRLKERMLLGVSEA